MLPTLLNKFVLLVLEQIGSLSSTPSPSTLNETDPEGDNTDREDKTRQIEPASVPNTERDSDMLTDDVDSQTKSEILMNVEVGLEELETNATELNEGIEIIETDTRLMSEVPPYR